MNGELAYTNMWLGILAGVSLAEFLMIFTMGIVGFTLYRRVRALVDRTEAAYVAPIAAKVHTVTDEAQALLHRAQRLEERAAAMIARVEDTASKVTSVAQYAWPVLGTWRAVSAAVGSLRGGNGARAHHDDHEPSHRPPVSTPRGGSATGVPAEEGGAAWARRR